MKNTLGIFTGKQKEYNIRALTILYNDGPLSAWELTGKLTNVGKVSLHATLNKRLRDLEKKSYLYRIETKWYLSFKGILAALIIQEQPTIWNKKWQAFFETVARKIEEASTPYLIRYGLKKENIEGSTERMGLSLKDFEEWVKLSSKVKAMMEKGIFNFDLIDEATLFSLIIMQTKTPEELSKVWYPEPR
jgi:hypothetical protein